MFKRTKTKVKKDNPDALGLFDNEALVQIGLYLLIIFGIIFVGSLDSPKAEKQEQQEQPNIEKVLIAAQKDVQEREQK